MYSLWNTENKSKLPPLIWQAPLAVCSLQKYLNPSSFFSLNFFTISNCRCFSECYEKLWWREGRCNLLSCIKTSLFFQTKKYLQYYFLKYIAVLPLFPHSLYQWCFRSPASSFSPAQCLSPRWTGGWPHCTQGWDAWRVWFGYQHQQGSLMLSEQDVSFQTQYFIFFFASEGNEPVGQTYLGKW